MKHLADLRNRANSQRYSRIYEDWRTKIVEDIEKSDGKKSDWGQKVPGTSMGTRAAEAPSRVLRVCYKILGREPGWTV